MKHGLCLMLALSMSVAGAQSAEAASSWVSVSSQQHGQGILLRRGNQCVVLTVAHVIKAYSAADVMLGDGRTVKFTVERVDEKADIALLTSDKLDPMFCPPIQTDGDIEPFLAANPYGQIPIVSGPNQAEFLIVSRTRNDGDKLVLQSPQPDQRVEPGLSGAAILFGGAVVGMAQDVRAQNGQSQVIALRWDALTRLAGLALKPTTADPLQRAPYDASWMPAEMQAVVQSTKAQMEQALVYSTKARELASQADALADSAIDAGSMGGFGAVPLGQAVSFLNKDADRRYGGQIHVHTSTLGSTSSGVAEGLGRSNLISGPDVNDAYSGLFRDGGLIHGVAKYGVNPGNPNKLLRYEGQMTGVKSGYGTIYWVDGRKYVGQFSNDNPNGFGALYPNGEDGDRIDAFRVDGNPKGYAIVWSPEGKFLTAEFWAKGKWVRNIPDPRQDAASQKP